MIQQETNGIRKGVFFAKYQKNLVEVYWLLQGYPFQVKTYNFKSDIRCTLHIQYFQWKQSFQKIVKILLLQYTYWPFYKIAISINYRMPNSHNFWNKPRFMKRTDQIWVSVWWEWIYVSEFVTGSNWERTFWVGSPCI